MLLSGARQSENLRHDLFATNALELGKHIDRNEIRPACRGDGFEAHAALINGFNNHFAGGLPSGNAVGDAPNQKVRLKGGDLSGLHDGNGLSCPIKAQKK